MYMMDTNICMLSIRRKSEKVLKRLMAHAPSEICISSITYAELCQCVEKSQSKARNILALTLFLSEIEIIKFDDRAAQEYGRIQAELAMNGKYVGTMDALVAAHARSEGMIMVTNNVHEFSRVENLCLEDWTV